MKNKDFFIISAYDASNHLVTDIKMSNSEMLTMIAFSIIGCAAVLDYVINAESLVKKIKEKSQNKD